MRQTNGIALLFKPFTVGEVAQLTGIPHRVLDAFIASGQLQEQTGDDGPSRGLNIAQTFAVFCVSRWLAEGCDDERANRLLNFLVASDYEKLMRDEVYQGNTFPCLSTDPVTMVPAPNSRLGRELNLGKLNREFRAALDRVFPQTSVTVPTGGAVE